MYECFVVCPFGSKTRTEEDLRLLKELAGLKKHVFRRAEAICEKEGYSVRIVESRETATEEMTVTTATQRSIDVANAIIVVLTADNPNVFIELGWAQGMWQDPILLLREGYRVPIDINNLLGVPFTSAQTAGQDSPGAKETARLLAKKIIERIKGRKRKAQFPHWPNTTLSRGQVNVYNRFSKAISLEEWSDMLRAAEQEIIVASSGMSKIAGQSFFWRRPDREPLKLGLGDFLYNKALEGVRITVLMYHEDNVSIGYMKKLETDVEGVKREVRNAYDKWATLRDTYETASRRVANGETLEGEFQFVPGGGFSVVQIRQRHLALRVTLTEKRAIATARFYTEIYNSGLCIDAPAPEGTLDPDNMPVYTQIKAELNFLIEQNLVASETRYQNWLKNGMRL